MMLIVPSHCKVLGNSAFLMWDGIKAFTAFLNEKCQEWALSAFKTWSIPQIANVKLVNQFLNAMYLFL